MTKTIENKVITSALSKNPLYAKKTEALFLLQVSEEGPVYINQKLAFDILLALLYRDTTPYNRK